MSFNGSGVYTRLENWTTDAASGILIRSDRMDTEANDFASAHTLAICKDGQSTAINPIPFAQGVRLSDGLVGSPSAAFTSETSTGFYRIGAGSFGASITGTRVATFNSGGLDNTAVGAGTPAAGAFTTVNKVTITAPAASATLTIANTKTLTSSNTLTLAGTDATTITFQATDTYVGRATTDTLTNKTYDTAGTGNVLKVNGTTINAISGNTSKIATTTGTLTSTHLASFDASGNIQDGGAPVFSKTFTSSQQTLTSAGSLTLPHSLGAVPFLVTTYLVAQNTVSGYTAGDVLLVSLGVPIAASADQNTGAAVTVDSTNINVKFTSQTVIFSGMTNKSDGTLANFANTDWKLVVKAVA